jgi:hypothetical protein
MLIWQSSLVDADVVDAQLDGAARNLYLCHVAHLFVEQTLRNRCLYRDLTLAKVGLGLAYDGVNHLLIGGEIGHFNLRHNLYGIAAQARRVYNLCLGDGFLHLGNLVLKVYLCFLGSIVF